MRRILVLAILLLCSIDVPAQDGQTIRPRFPKKPGQADSAPSISITGPTALSNFSTTASSIELSGTASDDSGVVSVVASCLSGCTVTGSSTANGTTTWTMPVATAGAGVIGSDVFAPSGTNDILTTRTPTVGTAWTEIIDTLGTAQCLAHNASGGAAETNTNDTTGNRLACGLTPVTPLAGPDYTWSGRVNRQSSSGDDVSALLFGIQDTTPGAEDMCVAWWYVSGGRYIHLDRWVNGMRTQLARGDGYVGVNDVVTVDVDGSNTFVTVGPAGEAPVTVIPVTAAPTCDDGLGVGVGWGDFIDDNTDDMVTGNGIDDVTLTDRSVTSGGISLAIGDNVIRFTATDTGSNTSVDTITVTRTAADTTLPQISILQPTTNPTYPAPAAAVTLSGTASDNIALLNVTWACPGATPASGTATGGAGTGTQAWSQNISVPSGDTVCTVTANDTAMPANTAQKVLTISYAPADMTPPDIDFVLPTSGTTYAASGTPLSISGTATDTGGSGLSHTTFTSDVCGNGALTGTVNWSGSVAIQGGVCNITVHAFDVAGNTATDTLQVTLPLGLTISTTAMPNATQNLAYNLTLSRTGGTAAFTWREDPDQTTLNDSDAQCAGLSISTAGVVSGTPTQLGVCSWVAHVTDSLAATDTQALTVTIVAAGTGPNSHYDNVMLASPFFERAYSLRPQSGVTLGAGDGKNPNYEHQLKLRTSANGFTTSGYSSKNSGPDPYAMRYLPYEGVTDTSNANPQDAMRIDIDPFQNFLATSGLYTIVEPIADSTAGQVEVFNIANHGGTVFIAGRAVRFADGEVIQLIYPNCSGNPVTNQPCAFTKTTTPYEARGTRGSFGTEPGAHADNERFETNINTVRTNLVLPLCSTSSRQADGCGPAGAATAGATGTIDGRTYLFQWDTYFDESAINNGLTNHKWFNFHCANAASGASVICLEWGADYGGGDSGPGNCQRPQYVAGIGLRYYGATGGPVDWNASTGSQAGPGVTNVQPLQPFQFFCVPPNKWVRLTMRFEQRANDYDYITTWAQLEGDANATKLLNNLPVSLPRNSLETGGPTLRQMVVQYNTSTDWITRTPYDMTWYAYMVNWSMLSDAGVASAGAFSDANMSTYLVAPLPRPAN